ncbi:MAG: hypothetical protein COW71_13480 [Ignavibacteriales bacterium CG18_big_fil_WC_8_21_14_2_50_31_20]|nr:MAG: hypothetical protein COW71_13480 [Ignavibacteriales bacterium CG18_big_fil_WC_8_21_14_2_50_31_20]
MFYIGIAMLGIFAFSKLGVDLLPNVVLPHLMVQTTYNNATPEEIEKLVTEPLESAVGTIPGVKDIKSVSKEGVSIISIDFVWGTEIDKTILTLREKLDNIRFVLPREAGRPSIIRANPSSTPIMSLVVSYKSRKSKVENRKLGEQTNSEYLDHYSPSYEIERLISLKEISRVIFKRRLEQLDGVAQAVLTGGLEREILIEVDLVKLDMYEITYNQIESSLKSSNVNLPAGSIMKGLFRYSMRTLGEYANVEEIGTTIIKRNENGSVILLRDIANIKENFTEREGLTRLNGAETVGLLIYKEPESNTVSISESVNSILKILEEEYPEYDMLVVSDQADLIQNAISNVKQEILFGGVLAVFVLFFFLGSLRNIFIIGITIPSSLVLTVLLMYLFEINFNIISLGGIAVGIGMLLDNAIVVIENIHRHEQNGLNKRMASILGASEVAMPITAATLTTIAVFLPLIFVKGIAGELFKDQSYAIAFSLSASIITALTLIPMLASREKLTLIKRKEKYEKDYLVINYPTGKNIFSRILFWIRFPFVFMFRSIIYIVVKGLICLSKYFSNYFSKFFKIVDNWMEKLIEKYELLLEWALKNKKTTILITATLLLLTILAALDIDKEFIPETPQDQFIVELHFPKGTSLEGNAEITSKVERVILAQSNVLFAVSNIGRVNEFDFMNKDQTSVNKTNIIVKLDSYKSFYDVQKRLNAILKELGNIKYSFKQVKTAYSTLLDPSENDIEIKIKNNTMDKAYLAADTVLNKINSANISGLTSLRIGTEKGIPEYQIKINREKCGNYGIQIKEVSQFISNIVKGSVVTYLSDFDKKIAINIKTPNTNRDAISDVLNESIISNNLKIPLRELIDVELTKSYNEIWHENQRRTVYLYANVEDGNISNIIKELESIVSSVDNDKKQTITIGGTNDEIKDSFSKLYIALIISVLLMYMVLAMEFESFLFPFIILFSVPLGLIGGILLLYVLGESISIISIMGLIILVGIADNDAVVKVEFIMRKRKEGLAMNDAIMQAGKDRFRPIVMNSFTVIFALIPMMIGIGVGTQLRISLSLAVAGGLLSATFLTLIVIPVLYTYFEKWSNKKY